MFRALPCSSSGGLRRNCIYAASGIVTLCRWLSCAPVKKELQFFLNRYTALQVGGYVFDSRLEFFIDIILPAAVCPWG